MRKLEALGITLAICGSLVFIGVLFISAYWEPDIRWLHFFQSWMYILAIVLLLRRNRWGFFIGASAALFWDYVNVFVTTFLKNGLAQLRMLHQTGHMPRPDQFVSVPGWFGNAAVIVGSLLAYSIFSRKEQRDWLRAACSFVATTSYFAFAIYVCQPRYLALFAASLHPRLRI